MMGMRVFAALAAAVALTSVAGAQETIYGMTAATSGGSDPGLGLVRFQSNTPGTIVPVGLFTGVVAGHSVREIDFRPATGQLYAVSTQVTPNGTFGQIYTVNLTNAALTPVGGTFALTSGSSGIVSMDFNPSVDRIRLVNRGTTGNSYRVNPDTGALLATDTSLFISGGATVPDVAAIAYSNNVPGAPGGTTLYAWNYSNDALQTIGGINGAPSPNTGEVFNVFVPGVFRTFNGGMGMDISGATGTAYVTHDDALTGTSMGLYTINLTTGAETFVGGYGQGIFIADISVLPVPTPSAAALLGLGGLLVGRRRR